MPRLSPEVGRGLLLVLAVAGAARAGEPRRVYTLWPAPPPAAPPVTPELLALGGRVYRGACAGCHGEKGDGLGREGKFLGIPPRDFTTGQFLVRTTPAGSLPLDADLFSSIRRGFKPQVGMPAFAFLSDREVWGVVAHLKSFSPRWRTEKPAAPLALPVPPPRSAEAEAAGKGLFMGQGACFVCHGFGALGDGPAAPGLTYASGSHKGKLVRPANLSRARDFKGGFRPEDIFRSISTGLDGTPMPGFAGSLTVEQRWQLVAFIQSLNPAPTTAESPARLAGSPLTPEPKP